MSRVSNSFVLVMLFLNSVGCFSSSNQAPGAMQASVPQKHNSPHAIEAIKSQSRRLSDAYIRGDIEALISIYTPDGVAAPGGRDFIRGLDALYALWTLPEGRTILRHSSTPIEIIVDGDHAYDWGYYEGQAAQNGEPLDPFRGTYLIVWERGEDGIWRIAVDMWNSLRD